MIVLEKDNVVREHEMSIQIQYEYPSFRLLQKPIVASAAIFLLFIISIGLNKLSFTIGKQVRLVTHSCYEDNNIFF